jgi:large repetitive protein
MAKAIDFAVRTSAGTVARGAVSGDGAVEVLAVGPGEAVSLNLTQASVMAYQQQGQDLVITLVDGRQITLTGYFDSFAGEENKLYLSANGDITEVVLTESGDGAVYASYSPIDAQDAYASMNDIRFASEDTLVMATAYADDTVGMAAFAPALFAGLGSGGVGTAAVVAGGVGVAGVLVSEVGGGGSKTSAATSAQTETSVAEATSGAATQTPSDDSAAAVDTTPPAVSSTAGVQSVGDIESLAEYQDGVTIAGEGEPGAAINVTIQGVSRSTQVDANGNWSVTFDQSEIPAGENSFPVTITATDAMGNQTVLNDTVQVDTVANAVGVDAISADNVVNNAEASGEVTVTGTAAAGATVTLDFEGTTQTVTADENGVWALTYPAGSFAISDGARSLTATSIDAAGNASSTDHSFVIDRTASVSFSTDTLTSDNVINREEALQGVVLTGQAEIGTTSVVIDWNGFPMPATVAADGSWTVTVPTENLPPSGTTSATVTATDAYGNTAISARDITVDWSTFATVDEGQAGGDNIITASEADNGITITGTTDVDASVAVTFQGRTHSAVAAEDGTWSVTFTADEIRHGSYADGTDNTVTVTATDAAQNVATTTYSLAVDTEVSDFARTSLSSGSDAVLNNEEAGHGLTVTGTVEAGSSVQVSFGDFGSYDAEVTGTSWTVTIPQDVIPAGETEVQLTAVATDALGNVSAPYTEMIDIDRIVSALSRDGGSLGGDGVLNATEIAGGLDLHGTSEAGATIIVTLPNGEEATSVADSCGMWSTRFEAGQLPQGEGSMVLAYTATDLAGNTASFSETVAIDTIAHDAPNVTEILKSTSGATGLSGLFLDETIDSSFSFYRVGEDGSHSNLSLKAGSLGSDYARFDGATVPEGDYLIINHADTAGNDSATLLVTNNTGTSTVDLGNTALQGFDFTSLDLTLAPANMTISAEDLIAITGPANTLVIKGGADDHLTLQDATLAADQSSAPDGFTLYTLGDHAASVYLDDHIQPTY